MKLIVDANVIISAVIRSDGLTRSFLFNRSLELSTPRVLLAELEEHKLEVMGKSGLSELEFSIALARLFSNITLVAEEDFGQRIPDAALFSPDIDDLHYLALALHLRCPLWSNDKRLKRQNRVQILSTHELSGLLGAEQP